MEQRFVEELGVNGEGVGAISGDGLENVVGGFGPDEGLRVVVVNLDEGGDGGFEFVHAAMNAALDLLSESSANQRSI
jgi:hypothetical protein